MATDNTSKSLNGNPWKGLNYYQEGEVLYGRDEEIQSLTLYVTNNTQTVLYGKSGIGKSSIINAGVFPLARKEGLFPIPIRLKHDRDTSYIDQIKTAFEASGIGIRERLAPINKKAESLWEYLHRNTFYVDGDQPVRPLIVLDQFEEIFTLQQDENKKLGFFSELADLLNEIMPQYIIDAHLDDDPNPEAKPPAKGAFQLDFGTDEDLGTDDYVEESLFNIVFTIREDFLSHLERYTKFIPVMKTNRYALLPINEEQAADIIMKPQEGLVDQHVAKIIIEKVTGRTDFSLGDAPEIEVDSAILSLYLSRLYIKKGEGNPTITADLVNKFSSDIIKDFYEESVGNLPETEIEKIEDQLLTYDGRRNNVSRNDLIREGVSKEVIKTLVEDRKLLRQFSYQDDIRVEFMHDILCPVVDARINRREELQKQQKLLQQQMAERRRYRRWMIAGLSLAAIVIAWFVFNWWWNVDKVEVCYANFVRQNGWPVGVGEPLSSNQQKEFSFYYRLSRKGHNPSRPFSEVECCSSTSLVQSRLQTPLAGQVISQDERATAFARLLGLTRNIRFFAESEAADAPVAKEIAMDEKGNILFVVNYSRNISDDNISDDNISDDNISDDNDADDNDADDNDADKLTNIWAVFTDGNGRSMKVRDNGADRIQVFLNNQKMEVKYMFYDEHGTPRKNDDIGCYGFRVTYDELNRIDTLVHLDPFSQDVLQELKTYRGDTLICSFYTMDEKPQPVCHPQLGYFRRMDIMNRYGNIVERRFYKNEQEMTTARPAFEICHFDALHRPDTMTYLNPQRQFFETRDTQQIAQQIVEYVAGSLERRSVRQYVQTRGHYWCSYNYSRQEKDGVVDVITDNISKKQYRHERITTDTVAHVVEYAYFGRNGQPVFDEEQFCHRFTEQTWQRENGRLVVEKYYDEQNNLYYNPADKYAYAVDSSLYDDHGQQLFRIQKDNNYQIVRSMGYEIHDGVEVARYVRGIEGGPVRCPHWERDSLCYHKLNKVSNFDNSQGFNLAYVTAVSEYPGCQSYLQTPSSLSEGINVIHQEEDIGQGWMKTTNTTITFTPIPESATKVLYFHLTQEGGTAQQAGLHDGDIIVGCGAWTFANGNAKGGEAAWQQAGQRPLQLSVMRYKDGRWSRHQVELPATTASVGGEVHLIPYTSSEYQFFSEGMSLQ